MNRSLILLVWMTVAARTPTAFAVTPPPGGGYPNENTALGDDALFSLTTGTNNSTVGFNALYSNTTGFSNTANGHVALFSNTTGAGNTANGESALYSNTTGAGNTATGAMALFANTTGVANLADGAYALFSNTTASGNTAVGDLVLFSNTTGNGNTGLGGAALEDNSTGSNNVALGGGAMIFNTSGSTNTAVGSGAMSSNVKGGFNTAVGSLALFKNRNGDHNIALGDNAGINLTGGSQNIDIGNNGVADDSGTIRIGFRDQTNTYIAGISGVTVAGGVAVMVGADGHLGTVTSSARYKEAIRPMKDASAVLLALQPVTFRYKKDLDPAAIPQFGLVAEEVAKVDPDLVAQDESGKPYTVRYEAVNAMLLNEFLKEHCKVEEQGGRLDRQETEIAELKAMVREQATQLQKVNARLEADPPAPRLVSANR